ncbi:MAG: class I SAM-dependent RNA methyltransferase [Hyphomicrobiaceae bacterium]
MTTATDFEIFLATAPGLEATLCAEARELRFRSAKIGKGGVTIRGLWPDVWRANLELRGASRVIARFTSFRAMHLAQLDKRARRVPWGDLLRPERPFRVEATCVKSRIYHSGAAAQRIERAIREELGAPASPDATLVVKARIEDDLCVISIDTSGEPLHKRGHKEAVNKAPMRENLAAMFLRQCGYAGNEPVLDPMCGSGTFVIEAAEIAAGLAPGRTRAFAFEQLATFDAASWQSMRASHTPRIPAFRFHGSDRDPGAVRMSRENAARAGVSEFTAFEERSVEEIEAPDGPKGLVIVNPPYGARIGESASLQPLYRSLGHALTTRFGGWRVGMVTTDPGLAKATGLPFGPPAPPVLNGGLRVMLFQTGPLP